MKVFGKDILVRQTLTKKSKSLIITNVNTKDGNDVTYNQTLEVLEVGPDAAAAGLKKGDFVDIKKYAQQSWSKNVQGKDGDDTMIFNIVLELDNIAVVLDEKPVFENNPVTNAIKSAKSNRN